jgi:hypothetical protein
MAFDREKFKALVHYICWKSEDPSTLGAVKLNKTLWVADFSAYLNWGESITGATYVKRQYGPVPTAVLDALSALEHEKRISIRDAEYFGFDKKEFFARTKPNLSAFTAQEISLTDEAIQYVCREHTARSISNLSHDDIWKLTKIGEEIPYYTVFARPAEITETDIEWAKVKIEELSGT